MPVITLHTTINAPVERVFDLARSIDLHVTSTQHTGERAVAGRTHGLIGAGESVTWRARHLGFTQELTSKIAGFEPPFFFADEMVSGAFKSFRHEHRFERRGEETIMKDTFSFETPLGWLGDIVNKLFLTSYMETLLEKRNQTIKAVAESEEWRRYIDV